MIPCVTLPSTSFEEQICKPKHANSCLGCPRGKPVLVTEQLPPLSHGDSNLRWLLPKRKRRINELKIVTCPKRVKTCFWLFMAVWGWRGGKSSPGSLGKGQIHGAHSNVPPENCSPGHLRGTQMGKCALNLAEDGCVLRGPILSDGITTWKQPALAVVSWYVLHKTGISLFLSTVVCKMLWIGSFARKISWCFFILRCFERMGCADSVMKPAWAYEGTEETHVLQGNVSLCLHPSALLLLSLC